MRVAIIANPRGQHQVEAAHQMAAGFHRHGVAVEMFPDDPGREFDLVAMWGVRRADVFRRQRAIGRRVLVAERAYLGDRYRWTSLGFDGLNGRADFGRIDRGPERAARYWLDALKPWAHFEHSHGAPVALVVGQCPGDMSLGGINVADWAEAVAAELTAKGWRVYFRAHPLRPPERRVKIPAAIDAPLDLILPGFDLVVTYNSNSGVDALVAGVPVVSLDQGSMVWPVTAHDVGAAQLGEPDRQAWLDRLAWCQWLPEEIASGAAWDHLKSSEGRRYFSYTVEKIAPESV